MPSFCPGWRETTTAAAAMLVTRFGIILDGRSLLPSLPPPALLRFWRHSHRIERRRAEAALEVAGLVALGHVHQQHVAPRVGPPQPAHQRPVKSVTSGGADARQKEKEKERRRRRRRRKRRRRWRRREKKKEEKEKEKKKKKKQEKKKIKGKKEQKKEKAKNKEGEKKKKAGWDNHG
eukprot:GHVT01044196.1.p1 GENE.GHVT01044196.1~~GHVT01044196.1.p1  ORF type:complete len:177 (+),score=52.48 GHVT01044196.1:2068-2598(+)